MKHILDALQEPALIEVEENLYVLRFESMKLACVDAALDELVDRGVVRPGDTVVDSSSGIYAVALAMGAHKYGLRAHIMASTTVDDVTALQLRSLGATIEQVPPSGSLKLDQGERVRRVHEYLRRNPDAYWMRQYHDPIHYRGYRRIAARLTFSTPPRAIDLVGSVGSGASTYGLWEGLSEQADCVVHGIQPFGSVTFGSHHVDDPDMIIAGVGSAIHFDNVDHALYESIDWIGYRLAASATLRMYRHWGVFAGVSTGCGYLVAQKVLGAFRTAERPTVVVAPDTGHRYAKALSAASADVEGMFDDAIPVRANTPAELTVPWSRAEKDNVKGDWDEFRDTARD